MYELRITRATPNNYELKVGDLTIPSNGGMEVRYHTEGGMLILCLKKGAFRFSMADRKDFCCRNWSIVFFEKTTSGFGTTGQCLYLLEYQGVDPVRAGIYRCESGKSCPKWPEKTHKHI